MGGKTAKSTSQVTIPQEVLDRYNAVNAMAAQTAQTPFQPYSYNPANFVAPLTPTQLAGIQNINYAAGQAQPYFDQATGQLMGGQMAAVPYYAQAGANIAAGQGMGQGFQQNALNALYGAQAGSAPFNAAAAAAYQQGYGQAQPLLNAGVNQIAGAQGAAQPYQQAAAANIGAALGTGAQLAQGAYAQQAQAGAAAAPIQAQALAGLGQAGQTGQGLSAAALQSLAGAQGAANPLQQAAQNTYAQAIQGAQPFNQQALQQYFGGLAAAAPISQAALANLAGGQQSGQALTGSALAQLGAGQAQATPIQQNALQNIAGAVNVAAPLTGASQQNIAAAQQGAAPYQQMATELGLAGARGITPGALTGAQIGQFMSPYMSSVIAPTQALLNQQAQQAQSEQLGNAIRSGAFGGDRAGIAAANLQQQQQLAQGKVLGDLLQSGYNQALSTAQQQQQLGLSAEQANRAAQQQASAQLLGIGQAGFGQGMSAAQQQAALAQQMYGQVLGSGQAQSALAQQIFGQGATSAQQQQAAANALFGQGATAAQQQAALAQQLFGQGATMGQNIAGLGQQTFQQGITGGQAQQNLAQQMFGQGATTAQQQAALAQALFGQGATTSQQQAALAQQIFGQGMSQAQQQAALSQLLFGQGTGAAQQQAALGQQLYGQGLGAGQALLGAGQQAFQQGTGFGTAQQGLGQQIFGQGLSAAQQQAALGQQGFAQALAAAQAQQGLGQGLYGLGAGTAQQLAALGTGAQAAALQSGQAQLGAGQTQQQTAQAGLQALYNQFMQQQAYPFQVAQFLGNIAMGTGALSGSTTTQISPGGYLSDRRLKENVAKIGETNDGQPIYRYNYKGDDKTQIGLMAQDVERSHPEAVGLAGGYKTVDYDKATRDAAAHEGGSVTPYRAGHGFAVGGSPDGGQVIPYMGGSSPTALNIPTEKTEVKKLETPNALPEGRRPMDDVMDIAKIAAMLASSGIFASGGTVGDRHGYADGGSPGLVDPSDMAALLRAQAEMFGPYMQVGRPMGGTPGAAGFVPSASLPIPSLAVSKAEFQRPKSGIEQIKTAVDAAKSLDEAYDTGEKIWKKITAPKIGKSTVDSSSTNYNEDENKPMYAYRGGLARAEHAFGGIAGRHGYADGGTEQSAFDRAADFTIKHEGSPINPAEPGGGISKFGITSRWHKDVDVPNLTAEQAKDIYKNRYWNAIDGDKLDPKIATIAFDSAMMMGPSVAKRFLSESGGDPDKYMSLRESFLDNLVSSNPEKYGKWQRGWSRRNADLREHAAAYSQSDTAAPSAPTAGGSVSTSQQAAADAQNIPSQIRGLVPDSATSSQLPVAVQPPSTTSGGLAPPAETAPTQNAPHSRMDQFMDWVKKKENFIPILSGIAAMGTAPTRSLGVALATGAGGYGAALQQQREFQQAQERIGVQQTQAESQRMLAQSQIIANSMGIVGQRFRAIGNGMYFDSYDPTGKPITSEEYIRRISQLPGMREYVRMPGVIEKLTSGAPGSGAAPVSGGTPAISAPAAASVSGGAPAAEVPAAPSVSDEKTAEQTGETPSIPPVKERGASVLQEGLPTTSEQIFANVDKRPEVQALREQIQNALNKAQKFEDLATDYTLSANDATRYRADAATARQTAAQLQNNLILLREQLTGSDIENLSNLRTARLNADQRDLQSLRDQADSAYLQRGRLSEMSLALDNLREGDLGPLTQDAVGVGKTINQALQALGGRPIFDTSRIADLELLMKDSTRLGFELSRSLGREPGFIVQQSIGANPGIANSVRGARRLISSLDQAAQERLDRNQFYEKWMYEKGNLVGARDAFMKEHPPSEYINRAIVNSVDSEDLSKLRELKEKAAKNPALYELEFKQIQQAIDRVYGRNVSNLILGGT